MIDFDLLENNVRRFSEEFASGSPFEHVVIDGFCESQQLSKAISGIPDPETIGAQRSRDYIFARNKFEKAKFDQFSPGLAELKSDLLSSRFARWISIITGQEIFIDPEFHGGGLHQGGADSFLNMHADFNYHPMHANWFRNVNILLYLNQRWESDFGGELKLRDGRAPDSETIRIAPLFNRAVIMFTREFTLHGYDPVKIPIGRYRSSIAAYGYSERAASETPRTTVWYPEDGGWLKKFLGKQMPRLVRMKSAILGSGTSRNQ